MDIRGTTTNLPLKRVVREKGQFHAEVMEIIEACDAAEAGEYVVAAFEAAKVASVRAAALRKAGYEAYTRGNDVYARAKLVGDA